MKNSKDLKPELSYYQRHKKEMVAKSRRYQKKHKDKYSSYKRLYKRNYKFTHPQRWLLNCARHRAKERNIPFNLNITDIKIPGICPVLGIPLFFSKGGRTNNTPTVDRIIPEKGYITGNIIVISWRANHLRNDASINELEQIYKFYKNLFKTFLWSRLSESN